MGHEKITELTIGIDISKALLDVATYPDGEFKQFTHDNKGHKARVKWLDAWQVKLIVFEATGAYHRGLEGFLSDMGLPFTKVNPRQAKRFGEATSGKTLASLLRPTAPML